MTKEHMFCKELENCFGMGRVSVSIVLFLFSAMLILPRASTVPALTTVYTSNWSGYVATAPGQYTSVSASWVVPSVSTSSPPAYSSAWIGIGGWNSTRLIQVGTDQDVLNNGSAVYFAWREVYPGPVFLIGYVSPSDSIAATISQVSANASMWRMLVMRNSATFLDLTLRARVSVTSQKTADFIVERPAIQVGRRDQLTALGNFGTVTFSQCSTNQGALVSLTSAVMVVMTGSGNSTGQYLAQPGTLEASNDSFTVRYSGVSVVDEFSGVPLVFVLALISSVLGFKLIQGTRRRKNRPAKAYSRP
jgi:hypothetical protein